MATTITEEDIKRALEILGPDCGSKDWRQPIWHIDDFSYLLEEQNIHGL